MNNKRYNKYDLISGSVLDSTKVITLILSLIKIKLIRAGKKMYAVGLQVLCSEKE